MIRRTLLTGLLSLILGSTTCFASSSPTEGSLVREASISKPDLEHFLTVIHTVHHFYIESVSFHDLLNDATEGMLARLDPHSQYLDTKALNSLQDSISGSFVGIGVEVTSDKGLLKIVAAMDRSPAKKAGIQSNDLIFKINDTLIHKLPLPEAIKLIKGKKGTKVRLTILRKNAEKPLTFSIRRQLVKYNSVTVTELAPGYAHIRIALFQKNLRKKVKQAIKKITKIHPLRGAIIDLRNNPGGILKQANLLTGLFLTKQQLKAYHGETVSIKGRLKEENKHFFTKGSTLFKDVPLVVLINQASASASEIVAGALQDYKRAIVVGQNSFGKGSVQSVLPVGDDTAIKLTTSLYYTPAGREIQTKGVVPDVVIPNITVQKSKHPTIDLSESSYHHHITGTTSASLEKKKISNIDLAVSDYPLYEAWIILKGVEVLQKNN